ncbi:MAG: hypothetical protein PVH80_09015, partial [Anaerolineae bacterium]
SCRLTAMLTHSEDEPLDEAPVEYGLPSHRTHFNHPKEKLPDLSDDVPHKQPRLLDDTSVAFCP